METTSKALGYFPFAGSTRTSIYLEGKKLGYIASAPGTEGEVCFWLWDEATGGYVNSNPLASLNHAKALAEHHFTNKAA